MARKKNPEVHVDINSHNFADNPRAVMDKLGALSQRPHRTKTGGETKKPSERLKARRAKNTRKGYFPNPVDMGSRESRVRAGRAYPGEILEIEVNAIFNQLRAHKMTKIQRQAHVSYAQGMLFLGRELGIINASEYSRYVAELKGML